MKFRRKNHKESNKIFKMFLFIKQNSGFSQNVSPEIKNSWLSSKNADKILVIKGKKILIKLYDINTITNVY